MKRIFAAVMTFILLGCSVLNAHATAEVAQALEGDGMFSYDTEGWYGIGCKAEFDGSEGCGGSGCLSAALHTDGTGVGASVNLRKYLWYSISFDAKVNYEGVGRFQITPCFQYQDAAEKRNVELFSGVEIKNGEWTRVEGYFQAPVLLEIPSVSSVDNLYISGELQLFPKCIGNEATGYTFYVDNMTLTSIEGTLDSTFEKNLQYWNYTGNYSSVPFDAESEGVKDLEKADAFPLVASVMKFMPSGNKCDGPSQSVAMESGVKYEISAWFRGEDVQKDDNAFLILDRYGNSMGSFGANTTVLGRVDVSDGEWHRIKAVVRFPREHERKSGDATVYLRIANGTRYGGNAPGRTLVIAQCEIKKQENLIENSYFVKADDGTYASDHANKLADGTENLLDISEWNCGGELSVVYDGKNTYDGSKLYAKHTLTGEEDVQSVWQAVTLEGKAYDAFVWVRLGEDYIGDSAVGFLYTDELEPISEPIEVSKDKWTKIETVNYSVHSGERAIGFVVGEYNGDGFVTAQSGSVWFSDFTVMENHAPAVNITSVSVNGAFLPGEDTPDITVYTDSLRRNLLSFDYLLYDAAGGEYVSVYSGEIPNFKSGERLPKLNVYEEWAGLKMKLRLCVCNRNGEYGEEYTTEEYTIGKNVGPIDDDIIPFNEIFDNGIANGTFEQGIEGWKAENSAEIKWDNVITAGGSVGSMRITQTGSTDDGASCDFRIRRYRTYRFSADVKLGDIYPAATSIQVFLKYDNNGTEMISSIGTVILNDQVWQRLEKEFSLSTTLDALEGLTVAEDMYRDAKIVCKASRGSSSSDKNNLSEFYIDNVTVKEVNELEGTLFDKNFDQWKKRAASLEIVDFSPSADGVDGLIAQGEFPDVRKCLSVTGAVNAFCEGPEQTFYADADTDYELSLWVKAKDARQGDNMNVLMYHKSIDTYSTHGRVDLSDGKWHHIKAIITSPSSAKDFQGDMQMFTRFTDGGQDVFSTKPLAEPRTFYLAEFCFKKLDNAIKNPYFIRNGIYWSGKDAAGEANVSNWQFEGRGSGICNAKETYDGASMYGKMELTGSNDQSIGCEVTLERGTPYKFSFWAKTENVTAQNLQLAAFIGDKSNVIYTQNIAPNQWEKFETGEFIYDGDSGQNKIGFYLRAENGQASVGGGSILFESACLEKVTDIVPAVTASLPQAVCGDGGNAAVITKIRDIAMGYRCNYYLSDNKNLTQSRRVLTMQTDINAKPASLYCHLGWKGRYLCAGITPVNRFGVYGDTVYTDWVEVGGGLDLEASVAENSNQNITFHTVVTNNFNQGVWADFIYVYTDRVGEVKKIQVYKEFLDAKKSATYSNHRLKVDSDYENGSVTVYTWLGSQNDLIKFAPLMRQVKIK